MIHIRKSRVIFLVSQPEDRMDLDTILCENCLTGMDKIEGNSIDLFFTDLPYGQTARNKWDIIIPFDSLWKQIKRITKDNAAIVMFSNGMFTAKLMMSNIKMWKYNLIWEKTQPTGFLNAKKMPLRSHEDICVFYKNPPTYNPQMSTGHVRKISKVNHHVDSEKTNNYGEYQFTDYDSTERYPRSVLKFAKDTQKNALHPTQKPLALCEYIIQTYSNLGDTVCDCCCGSATIPLAAKNTSRYFLGFENDLDIWNMGVNRIKEIYDESRGHKVILPS